MFYPEAPSQVSFGHGATCIFPQDKMVATAEKKQHAASKKVKCEHFIPNCKTQMFEIIQLFIDSILRYSTPQFTFMPAIRVSLMVSLLFFNKL